MEFTKWREQVQRWYFTGDAGGRSINMNQSKSKLGFNGTWGLLLFRASDTAPP
ncbi:MAG: hypothetical protein R2874_06035 [Desulfobacterales bacterium]